MTKKGEDWKMAADEQDKATEAAVGTRSGAKQPAIGVRLIPTGDSDLPILSNYTRVQMSSAGVFVDFGFLEPSGLDMLARTARAGGKMPEAVQGRLAARFALTPDALLALHQQLAQVIAGLRAPRKKKSDAKPD
jgi:hypothetical protein